jgi:hypothetical protein
VHATAAFPRPFGLRLATNTWGCFLRRSTLACGLTLACALAFAATVVHAAGSAERSTGSRLRAITFYRHEIRLLRRETWHWQRVMGVHPSRLAVRSLAAVSIPRLQQVDRLWDRRERRASRAARHPPHLAAWLCIHRYEGSWTDSGAPYWGGLQMNLSFQSTYGGWLLRSKGTADHWSPLEQIWTAERAARSRGYTPWPNSARICGLIA